MNHIIAGDPAPTNPTDELARLRTRVEELETFARGCDGEGCILPHSSWCRTAREFAAKNSGCTCGEPWTGSPQTHAGHCWLLSPPDDELEWHRKRVAELLARVAELEAAAYGDAEVRVLDPVAQIRRLHDCVAAQLHRGDTLNRLSRENRARAEKVEEQLKARRAEVLAEAADRMTYLLQDTPEYGLWVAERLREMAAEAGESRG